MARTKKAQTFEGLSESWAAFFGMKDDPVKMDILKKVLDIMKARQEGKFTPELEHHWENFQELLRCINRLHGNPPPSPEEAQELEARIAEIELEGKKAREAQAAATGGAA